MGSVKTVEISTTKQQGELVDKTQQSFQAGVCTRLQISTDASKVLAMLKMPTVLEETFSQPVVKPGMKISQQSITSFLRTPLWSPLASIFFAVLDLDIAEYSRIRFNITEQLIE